MIAAAHRSANYITRAEAKSLGLTRYQTGIPCRRGHRAERYVSTGNCVECVRGAAAEWHREHYASDPAFRARKLRAYAILAARA
jgi:hypothetical protein